ncbi:helix-turn-helix domain-containing protein [Streptomyces sp. S1A1-7]|uniref:helix-turn-helix domain-containing protein n=1 Tax=Streptomyces sp. S1A1-7 TaxID=2594459 RepID=UPI001F076D02|nr:helix-turn-helix domain-containing protein [Streptomyces sp. S1A1-7]
MRTLERTDDLDQLLRMVRREGSLGEVLCWLGRRIGSGVAWVGGAGTVEAATPGFPRTVLSALHEQLDRLAVGRLAAATAQVNEVTVHIEAFGGRQPRPVLVTVSDVGLSREEAALASRAGGLLELLGRASQVDDSSHAYEEKARQMRFALLSALMAGEVTLARRMTTGNVPPLLRAKRVRVYLLHCPPVDRDVLARAYQDTSGYHESGLMVHCPAFKEHLICPVAEDVGAGGRLDLGEVLRRLVSRNPAYALGVSRVHPLDATAAAYGEALHALAVARNSPERLAAYCDQPSLVHVLPRRAALAWARAYVEPLQAVSKSTLAITRLALIFRRSTVARLLNISRNTVGAHCRRAEQILGLDLTDVGARAALNLALSLSSLHNDAQPDPGDTGQAASDLSELLITHPATAWAETCLRPLRDAEHRDLYATVRAWIEANTDAQQAAAHLGLSRNTVRARLRAAERLLDCDLLTTGSGIHDLVHALHAVTRHGAPPVPSGRPTTGAPGRSSGPPHAPAAAMEPTTGGFASETFISPLPRSEGLRASAKGTLSSS